MKKLSLIFAVAIMMAVTFVSCSKKTDDTVVGPEKQYASAISGQFIPQDGDIMTLKSAPVTPLVGGHQIDCYDIKVGGSTWTKVDGSEFLPGSLPALDWASYQIGSSSWWFSGGVYITYCPVLPMRVVLTATQTGHGSTPTYLGIWEGTPNQASFPITVQDRRLGDYLTINTDALTALPGYTNMSFVVTYTKSTIDLAQTIATSGVTTSAWPTYVYSSNVETTATFNATQSQGEQTVYEGSDAKVTGTVTIVIHVDNTTLTVSTPASALGHGMKITLKTNKVGWYNSGVMVVTENDIIPDTFEPNF